MRMYAIMIAVDPRLMNQPRTTAEAVLQVKNASDATAVERINAGIGTPLLVVLAKIAGALPCLAKPKMVLDAWKRRQLVQLHAEVMLCIKLARVQVRWYGVPRTYTTALQISGRYCISSRFMAMMNGDFATPFPEAIAVADDAVSYHE